MTAECPGNVTGGLYARKMETGQNSQKITPLMDKNSSGYEIANVNFYALHPEATRIR